MAVPVAGQTLAIGAMLLVTFVFRVHVQGEEGQDLADLAAAGKLGVRGDHEPFKVPLPGALHRGEEVLIEELADPLRPGAEVAVQEEARAEQITDQQGQSLSAMEAQQLLHGGDREQRVGIEEDVQPVHVHAVHAEPGEEAAEPEEQQQGAAQTTPGIGVPKGPDEAEDQPEAQQGPGAAVDGAEAVDGVPGQVRPLEKAHVPESFRVHRKLFERFGGIEDHVVGPDAVGEIGHGDKGQLHRLPAHGVDEHGAVDGEGEAEINQRAGQCLPEPNLLLPQ